MDEHKIINVMIYKHDRNGLLIGDFQDPKYSCPVTAIAFNSHIILFTAYKGFHRKLTRFRLDHTEPEVFDILLAVSKYTNCEVQTEDNGRILIYRMDTLYHMGESS